MRKKAVGLILLQDEGEAQEEDNAVHWERTER